MTQKGLDAVDKIIKNSPQYLQLIKDFLEDIGQYNISWSSKMKDEFIINLLKKYEEM